MSDERWLPRCPLPDGLEPPRRIDPTGVSGPTRGQAQGGRWRASSRGWYVPATADPGLVEQRILEQSVRAGRGGAVAGWGSLRWRGAAYFDGTGAHPDDRLPVPLLRTSGARRLRDGHADISRAQLAPAERELVAGTWCTTAPRSTFDEVVRLGALRPGVTALCMSVAAGVTSVEELKAYAETRPAWTGIPLYRECVALCREGYRSPPEVSMHLRWQLDAGLPEALVNRPVFDRQGRLLGIPDLLDVEAGVVGEYDGAIHRRPERHRHDVARHDDFRRVGLEYFTVVAGDLADERLVVARMHATRSRALFLGEEARRWTVVPPPWWTARYSAADDTPPAL